MAIICLLVFSFNLHAQWDTAFYQQEDYRIDDIWVFDSDNFMVVGDYYSGQIYSTEDGGETYYVYTLDNWIRRLFFINDSIGYAGGTDNWGIYKTTDRGRTWKLIESETFFMDIHYMYFFSEKIGFVEHKWTYDGGRTYEDGLYIYDVLRISDSVAFACSYDGTNSLVKTMDMGLTWEPVNYIAIWDLIDVGAGHYIAQIADGVLLHSYDTLQSFEDTTYIQGDIGNRIYIDFADSLNGIMATFKSTSSIPKMQILVSQDGGYTWFNSDIVYGRMSDYGNSPIRCSPDQTFINTYGTLLKSQKGSIGPSEKIEPVKPGSESSLVIPVHGARHFDLQSDSSGNIYFACTFQGQLTIGDTTLGNPYDGSLLFAKLDGNYEILWLHTFGSTDQAYITFNLVVFPDGTSVLESNLYNEYYLDNEGPMEGGHYLFHHNKDGEIVNQIRLEKEGYTAGLLMKGDNSSKIFLGGLYSGVLSVGDDSIHSEKGNFLLIWDTEEYKQILKHIADRHEYITIDWGITMGYNPQTDIVQYGAYYKDSIDIDGNYYFAHHQGMFYHYWPSYFLLNITPDGIITKVEPNFCASRTAGGGYFNDCISMPYGGLSLLGVQKDSIYFDRLYYTPELDERSFYIPIESTSLSSGLQFLGDKFWGCSAYQSILYQDFVIINASQDFKTQFGDDMIYNAGELEDDDNVILFYDGDMNYAGYYQLVDQHFETILEAANNTVYLGGRSYGKAVEFGNEILYNNGGEFYYIAELDFQYLYMEEPAEAIINPLKIFPNPSNGRFMIEIPEGCKKGSLDVYSLHGQLLHSSDFSNERETELFLDEPPGIYLIKLSSGKSIYTEKLIISRL